MSHCYPCSGSGWYVTSSYLSGSVEVPHLDGPFGCADEAVVFANALIPTSSSPSSPTYVLIDVFEHHTEPIEDAWWFYDRLANDAWCDENAEIITELIGEASGSALVPVLSGAHELRMRIKNEMNVLPADDVKALYAQFVDSMLESLDIMQSVFGPRT